MTVYMVPGVFGVGGQILDQNGNPVSGGLVNTYAAGTTSPVPVFTTAVGNVSASNPVVTGADGRLPYELWQTSGQTLKIILTDALANTLGTYDNLTGINDPTALLTTTNTWTASQSFNVIRVTSATITTLTVSTLSVASITSGVVPLARMKQGEAGISLPNITITSAFNTVTSVSLGSFVTGDRVFINAFIDGTKGATSGLNTISINATGVSYDIGPGVTSILQSVYFPAAIVIDVSLSGILRVSSAGTLVLVLKSSSGGSDTTNVIGNLFGMGLIGN